ncbi:MAG TPA: hypothetical protein VIK59_00600 [Verrucomicrobiae bacterium]
MLIRISLILALVAALAAGVLNVVVIKNKIGVLTDDRNTQRSQKETAQNQLASTKKTLAKTQDDLKQTQTQLADTQAERDKAVATATAQSKRADSLSDQLSKATQERDDAQNQLAAFTASGLTPAQVSQLSRSLKDDQIAITAINEEKSVLQRAVNRLTVRLNKYEGTNYVVTLRPDLRGKVVIVDPKWDFVVLNIGEDQGVLDDGELLVSRDGKLVAKVIVRSVEKNRSIANVVPGWELGQVIEGDEVTPAHPAS